MSRDGAVGAKGYDLNVEEPDGVVLQELLHQAAQSAIASHHRLAPVTINIQRLTYDGTGHRVWAEYTIGRDTQVRYSHGMRLALDWEEDR